MSKRSSVHLADIYPVWFYIFALSVPILFGMSLFYVNYNWAYMIGGAALTIILIIYTAVKLYRLFELRLIIERQRYDDDQRAQGYHFHHGFEESVENIRNIFNLRLDEHRKDSTRRINDISRKVETERDNLKKTMQHMLGSSLDALRRHSTQYLDETKNQLHYQLDAYINQTVNELDKKLQSAVVISNKLESDRVGHKEFIEHELQLRQEFQRSLKVTTSSLINKIGSSSEKTARELLEKTEQRLLSESEILRHKSIERIEASDKMTRELLERTEQRLLSENEILRHKSIERIEASDKMTRELQERTEQRLLSESEKLRHQSNEQIEASEKRSREDNSQIIKIIDRNQGRKIDNLRHEYSIKLNETERRLRDKYLTASTESSELERREIESLKGLAKKQSRALKEDISARIMAVEEMQQGKLADMRKEMEKRIQESSRHNHDSIISAVSRIRVEHSQKNGLEDFKDFTKHQTQALRNELLAKIIEAGKQQEGMIAVMRNEAEKQLQESNRRIHENFSYNLSRARENYDNQIRDLRQEVVKRMNAS